MGNFDEAHRGMLTDPGTKSQTTLKFCLNIFKRKCINRDLLQMRTQPLTNQSSHGTHSCGSYCLANTSVIPKPL